MNLWIVPRLIQEDLGWQCLPAKADQQLIGARGSGACKHTIPAVRQCARVILNLRTQSWAYSFLTRDKVQGRRWKRSLLFETTISWTRNTRVNDGYSTDEKT